jgi:hypothetical protein
MACVAVDAEVAARIDRYLAYLVNEWEGVPLLAEEWDEWDEHSQLSFVIDWPIREDRLHMLQRWAAQGLLSSEQMIRFEALLRLVEEHRPTLERMIAD